MSNFITRLFGGNNNTIKDPQLGKVRYLESEHDNVWAGSILMTEYENNIEFFLASREKVLKHESRNILIDILTEYQSIRKTILSEIDSNSDLKGNDIKLTIIHIPESHEDYEAELIYTTVKGDFSILWKNNAVLEFILHKA